MAVDKDAGLVVHPAPGHPSGTLINALLHRYRGAPPVRANPPEPALSEPAEASLLRIPPLSAYPNPNPNPNQGRPASEPALSEEPPAEGSPLPLPDLFGDGTRPGVVHRLDRYTTGLILAARSLRAQQALLA